MREYIGGMSDIAADLGTYMLYRFYVSFANGRNAQVVIFIHTHAAVHCRHTCTALPQSQD